jgi:hypothetical protein
MNEHHGGYHSQSNMATYFPCHAQRATNHPVLRASAKDARFPGAAHNGYVRGYQSDLGMPTAR